MIAYQEAGQTVVVNEIGERIGLLPPRVSIVYAYYRNPGMLGRHLAIWRDEWPDEVRALCEVVIVDDGSPEPAAPIVEAFGDVGMPVSVYRVGVDIPWNQHGARNLGAHVARGRWLLLTDMDHVIPPDTLHAVTRLARKDRRQVYTFARRDAPADRPWRSDAWAGMAETVHDVTGEIKAHVNSFAMTRDTYWRVGGYDETFCGLYGTDRLFRDRLYKEAPRVHLDAHPLIRVAREVIPDASTTTLPRKDGRDGNMKKRIKAEKLMRGEAGTIKTLQFPWERVI